MSVILILYFASVESIFFFFLFTLFTLLFWLGVALHKIIFKHNYPNYARVSLNFFFFFLVMFINYIGLS